MLKKCTLIAIVTLLFLSQMAVSQSSLPEKAEIVKTGKLVNDCWIKNHSQWGNNDWARAVYYVGNTYFYKMFPKNKYLDYSTAWAESHKWKLRSSGPDHADAQVCGQVYLALYQMDEEKQIAKIAAIKEGIDKMLARPDVDDWWWVDALFMSMPVFARLGVLYDDDRYFDKMHQLYSFTKANLYNAQDHLWYRDETVSHVTPNGKASYWSRGNGWAFAALALVLDKLPVNSEYRAEYLKIFKEMAASLKACQREDGFWNPSLIDPKDYGGPETSGTSLFLFGMAWGINQGVLDRDTYYSVITKAWEGLTTLAVSPQGVLTYVQGVGFKPSSNPATSTSTADFGVGAFLLACAETAKLASGDMPAVSNFDIVSLKATDKNSLLLEFNKEMNDLSALSCFNYTIDNNVRLERVEKKDSKSVLLVTSSMLPGDYQLKSCNVESKDGETLDVGAWAFFEYTGICSVKASDFQSGTTNTPDKVIDADMSTRWSSEGSGKWLLLDLGEERTLHSVRIAFYEGNTRKNYFNIELSLDNINFETVYQGESSGKSDQLENYDFSVKKARYVRLEFNGNSKSKWNSVLEVRIKTVDTASGISIEKKSQFSVVTDLLQYGQLTVLTGGERYRYLGLSVVDMGGSCIYNRAFTNIADRLVINDLWLLKGTYICTVTSDKGSTSQLFVVI